MKVFVALAIHPYRRQTFPFLKPYFSKSGTFREASFCDATFVATMDAATLVILPMSWNFYMESGHQLEVLKIIERARLLDKQVLSFMTGDYGIKIPDFDHLTVFRSSGNRSKLSKKHKGLPPFIEDPLKKIYQRPSIEIQSYAPKPVIGFCGMANFSKKYALEELTRIATRNLSYYFGRSKNSPQDLLPTTYRRAQLLKECMDDSEIVTNFIFRKKYFGGALTATEKKNTTREFFDNINNVQYILCFRGAGNFSVRLYETLAMGRIPVFINTDCLLPFENEIEWRSHVVWIDYKDRHLIAEKIKEFHLKLDSKQFEDLQRQNRMLWEKKLTLGGFFRTQLLD